MTNQREHIERLARSFSDPVKRAQRIYLEEPSFCLGRDRSLEYEIKQIVASGLGVPYRSVAIAGSAQLGFSPHKDRPFSKGISDLDLAIIDGPFFQKMFELCIQETLAFSNLSSFTLRGGAGTAEILRDQLLRRGMILVRNMPLCKQVVHIEQILARASRAGKGAFKEVNLAAYMSETLFCWKQNSALQRVITRI